MGDKGKAKIGISIGDINGIGLEVVLKTFNDQRVLDLCTPVVYGSSKIISYHRKALGLEDLHFNIINEISKVKQNTLNVLNCWNEEVNITFGEMTDTAGKYAITSLDLVAQDVMDGRIDAMVTAPVNKHNIQNIYPDFRGQTEYLAMKADIQESLMFLISNDLRVGLVTNHLEIKEVSKSITIEKILKKLDLMNYSLKQDFMIEKPKIAVLGLNPHAGDNGSIGNEEIEVIRPAIEEAKKNNILAFGPYAADGFFGSHNYQKFDAVLAMFHDQGLVPFKALTFGTGINYSAGLPIVRTSPDHGTAYEIAGKGEASENSFRNALFLALDIVRNRSQFSDMHKDPLVKSEFTREIG